VIVRPAPSIVNEPLELYPECFETRTQDVYVPFGSSNVIVAPFELVVSVVAGPEAVATRVEPESETDQDSPDGVPAGRSKTMA